VLAHGGTIEAERPPAGGTSIRITLPVHPGASL
jgi:signal transduction histidine kinase